MKALVYATIGLASLFALTSASDASASTRSALLGAETSSSSVVPKDVKAVCKSKVLRIKTDNWIELRRRQRCFS